MIRSGLTSITFRKLSPREIVHIVVEAGLDAIEWGGDVHVPHGDTARAREVGAMSRDAGLATPSYGSYYHVGLREPVPFEDVLETAAALEAPMIRVWPGRKGSAESDEDYRKMVVEDAQRIAEIAACNGAKIACEYHPNTLTDTAESAARLLEEVGRENFGSYWQPHGLLVGQMLEAIAAIGDRLANVHVFHWGEGRLPLAEGEGVWTRCLRKIAQIPGDRYALLEFVRDDDPDAFRADAKTLKQWLDQLSS